MTVRPAVRSICGALLGLLALGGCARHTASQAGAGVYSGIEKSVKEEKPAGEHASEIFAARTVRAAVRELASPEQVAHLRQVARAAAEEAVARALDAALAGSPSPVERLSAEAAGGVRDLLVSDLGETGPLAASLSGAVHRSAASATDGALERLFPGCAVEDAACLDRRISALSKEAANGFGRGLRESLGVPALVLAFLAGAMVTLMLVLAIHLEVKRREPHPEVARAT